MKLLISNTTKKPETKDETIKRLAERARSYTTYDPAGRPTIHYDAKYGDTIDKPFPAALYFILESRKFTVELLYISV